MNVEANRSLEEALAAADRELQRAARDHADAEAAARATRNIRDRAEQQVARRDAEARVAAAAEALVTMRRARLEMARRVSAQRLSKASREYRDASTLLQSANDSVVRAAVTLLLAVWAREPIADREHRAAIAVRAAAAIGLNEESYEAMRSNESERIPDAIDDAGDVTEWVDRPVQVLGDMDVRTFLRVVGAAGSVSRSAVSSEWIPQILLDAIAEADR